MLSLYLVRHGQTDCSLADRYCGGGCDVSLNDNGRQAADAIAKVLAPLTWQAIYSSGQDRALQTLEPLSDRVGIDVQFREELGEMNYGSWDGKTPEELQRDSAFSAWLVNPRDHAPPRGETARHVASRAMTILETIRTDHSEGNVLVASHKTTIRVLLCSLLGIDLALYRARIAQPLGAITVVTFRDTGPRLERLADVSHLPLELRYGS